MRRESTPRKGKSLDDRYRSLSDNGTSCRHPLLTVDQGQAFAGILSDLDDIGYSVRWWLQSATSVGAPHKRERVFITAKPAESEPTRSDLPAVAKRTCGAWNVSKRWPVSGEMEHGVVREMARDRTAVDAVKLLPTPTGNDGTGAVTLGRLLPTPQASDASGGGQAKRMAGRSNLVDAVMQLLPTPTATDANRSRTSGNHRCLMEALQLLPTPVARDSKGRALSSRQDGLSLTEAIGSQVGWGIYEPAIRRWEQTFGAPAPHPLVGRSLSADFVEWMMGFPPGWTDGLARTVRLRVLGNAVLPQVVEVVAHRAVEWAFAQSAPAA